MLRVTVELVPLGDETRARKIAALDIANVGGSIFCGDYSYALNAEGWSQTPATSCKGYIRRHRRDQSVWALVFAVRADWADQK